MSRRKSFVATPVAHLVGPGKLRVINGWLAFVTGKDDAIRLDPAALRRVYCFGDVGVTDEAFRLLFAHDVEVSWLTPGGTRCRGRLVRADAPRTALRILQHQAFLDERVKTELARRVVAEKIASQARAARHYQRQGHAEAGPLLARLRALEGQCAAAPTADVLRGGEGAASAAWFELLGTLLRPPWEFRQRQRRPPPDPVNALLSLGYTWLLTRTVARVEAAGLESALGALHEYRAGRPSLACDLKEPLRVPAVDRWVVVVCNGGQLSPADFHEEKGGVRLQEGAFGRMLTSWQRHWIEDEQERSLDGLVQEVIARLRAEEGRLPTPLGSDPEGEEPGTAASDEE
jgi:CRISPR-associated protein Cas1